MADYEDERPDWREIDRKKDRSKFYGKEDRVEKKERPKNRWQAGRVKEALDRLFMGEKGTVEHEKLYNRIHGSYGSERFLPAVQKYIGKYGLPDDISTLLLIIDTKDQDIIFKVLARLKELHPTLPARGKEDAKRKLSILAMTDKSKETKEKAREILDQLE